MEEYVSLKDRDPAICLSHDLDNLRPTPQMHLKQLVTQRRALLNRDPNEFFESLETLLEFNNDVAGRKGCSTVFIASKTKSSSRFTRAKQWLLDPTYEAQDPALGAFIELIRETGSTVGIHGSFYSLRERTLAAERMALERRIGSKIVCGRQHWLHLPSKMSMEHIHNSGLKVDSTLGWNGNVGFRCGFSKPFPLTLPNNQVLWEVPLLLMDGPLFDDMRLDTEGVVKRSQQLLKEVKKRGGCVSIDWHERAACPDYNWFEAYRRIVTWAKEQGFRFLSIAEAVQEYQ